MSGIATAIVGSAIIGGVVASKSADSASDAATRGAATAADATIRSTEMQIAEIQRQFDYQQRILLPQIQQQYNAQRAYSDLLGIGGPSIGSNFETGYTPEARDMDTQNQRRDEETAIYQQYRDEAQAELDGLSLESADVGDAFAMLQRRQELENTIAQYDSEIEGVAGRMYDQERIDAENLARGPQMGAAGSSGLSAEDFRREDGSFVDPNLDPTRLADESRYGEAVEGNLMAGTSYEDDAYNNYLRENGIAADSMGEDAMVQRTNDVRIADGAAGTGVYGDVFQQSPGYAFAVEEMGRATDRIGSAGGPNIGGRAIMEAQRRAQGLADQEYYNWAGGRERDLGRRGDAERADIQRGDQAAAGYESQRIQDVMREDQGYQDYLRRLELDAARLDEVGGQEDRLRAADLARSDQGYYNYLDALSNQAGFGGGPAAQAVDASQAAGAQTSAAYGSQGGRLAGIYGDEGTSQANIAYARGAGINNAIQSGVSNWITYKGQD